MGIVCKQSFEIQIEKIKVFFDRSTTLNFETIFIRIVTDYNGTDYANMGSYLEPRHKQGMPSRQCKCTELSVMDLCTRSMRSYMTPRTQQHGILDF